MSCIQDKELILYYYKDLDSPKLKKIAKHLEICAKCMNSYREIEALNSKIDRTLIELSSQETQVILGKVKEKISQDSILDKIANSISDLFKQAIFGLSYRPQLITAAVVLIAVLVVFPFFGKKNLDSIEKEFDILQIQMELAAEDSETSIFELYEDGLEFLEELTLKKKHRSYG